jgi:rare lipoprotein A
MALARTARLSAALSLAALAAACGGPDTRWGEGSYKVGRPYQINGRWYRPAYDPGYDKVGTASWYGDAFQGLSTANGEVFDRHELSAAHPTLPLPSVVRVTNLENGRSLDLRVNDRGPFVEDRLIDLSQAAARKLGFERAGLTPVRVRFLRMADARGAPPVPPTASATEFAAATAAPPRGEPTPRRSPPAAARPPRPLVLANARPQPARPPSPATLEPPPRRAYPAVAAAAVAALSRPARAAACPEEGPRYVQVGAFGDTARVHAATSALRGFGRVTVEPLFAGGAALARVRMGPAPDLGGALALLDRVQGAGYPEAFVVPAADC